MNLLKITKVNSFISLCSQTLNATYWSLRHL